MLKTTTLTLLATLTASQLLTNPGAVLGCQRRCPNVYLSVCGSDGTTYQSACYLQCVPGVQVINLGPCQTVSSGGSGSGEVNPPVSTNPGNTTTTQPSGTTATFLACSRQCTNIIMPVCGTDNNSYVNPCTLLCNPGVQIAYRGDCINGGLVSSTGNQNGSSESSACSTLYYPVCGADGKSYTNNCQAALANTTVAYNGLCLADKCQCNGNYNPVCGSNGKTFDNSCLAQCANVPIAYYNSCEDCSVPCPTYANYVCATNGLTYRNNCQLVCQGTAVLAQGGLCSPKSNCNCPTTSSPVCGANHQIYANQCLAECAGFSTVPMSNCQ